MREGIQIFSVSPVVNKHLSVSVFMQAAMTSALHLVNFFLSMKDVENL